MALLGCLHLAAGPDGVVQVMAWGKMVVTYSAEKGIATGIRETFDGAHPCDMCLAIARQKKEKPARQQPLRDGRQQAFDLKKQIPPETPRPAAPYSREISFRGFPDPDGFFYSLRHAPEMPPPQMA